MWIGEWLPRIETATRHSALYAWNARTEKEKDSWRWLDSTYYYALECKWLVRDTKIESGVYIDTAELRVLVCGGRKFRNTQVVYELLDCIHKEICILVIIEGNATGADKIASDWAKENGIKNTKFPANWQKYDRAAGPIRNRQMIEEGEPDLVVAFSGGKGTANMVKQAIDAGIEVVEV